MVVREKEAVQDGRPAPAASYRRYVDCSTGQVHLRIAEPEQALRPPVMCLHMSPISSYVYRNLLGELGRDRVTVAMDTPGFGMSDRPARQPAIEDYARVTLETVKALGLAEPIDLIGYHTGSITALDIARQAPESVRRIIMISAPVLTIAEREQLTLETGPQPLSEDGSHLMKGWQRFLEYNRGPGTTLEDMANIYPERLLGRTTSWWGHHAAFRYDFASQLAATKHEIRILNPRDDLWEITPRAKPLLQNGEIVHLPDWGHGFLDAYTLPAAALIREFLDAEAPFSGRF